ncbi:MAG: RidA family protein [Actinobacteria bacterium]|nr:RidA family protein [Actinomycetota bacterium]
MTTTDQLRTAVTSADAPAAIGPYSQAIVHDGLLYCSGALPLDPADGSLVADSPASETIRCLENLQAVCRAAGAELANALRVTIYTTQLERFADINEAYGAYFRSAPPARVTVGVAALPKGAHVEVDAIVALT